MTAMNTDAVIEVLRKKHDELTQPIPLDWKYPPTPPRDPLKAQPDDSWQSWSDKRPGIRKNAKHWLYATLRFPERMCGFRLDGTAADLTIHGWCPFTMWVDGRELFKEEHAWNATGPIWDPVSLTFTNSPQHRLIICLEPTEVPTDFNPLNVAIQSRPCTDTAIHVAAAAAQLEIARALARPGKETALVEKATRAVSLDTLEANDWKAALASSAKMEAILKPLSPRAKAFTVHLLGHSHIDMDWMWTWKDTVHCMRRDFKSVADMMDDYPDLTFAISQIPSYDVARTMDPQVFDKVVARVAEGRWENVAGTWVEGDLHMADGETVARHMLYAADWTRQHLFSKARTLWEPDTFGHPGNMPQLARLGEFDGYFHMRCNPGRENFWPVRLWEGIDGSTILAVTQWYNGHIGPLNIAHDVVMAGRMGLKDSLHIWGVGDHGGAMARHAIEQLAMFRDKPLMPLIRFSTISGFLEAVRKSRVKLPRNKGEVYSLFEGCWTTHVRLKKYNRDCEGALLTAEALSALAGLNRRHALREAWIPMMFNQFHDLLDGSAVHDSYGDAYRRAEATLDAARGVIREATDRLAPAGQDGQTLVILNPLGFERTEPVRTALPPKTTHLVDEKGAGVPAQKMGGELVFIAKQVPAFGRKTCRVVAAPPKGKEWCVVQVSDRKDYGEQGEYFRVETSHCVSRISKSSGIIGSYYDKKLGQEMVGYGVPKYLSHTPVSRLDLAMNVFQVIDESPNGMSAWLIHDLKRQENLLRAEEVKLMEAGPVFVRFRVVHKFRSSRIEEDIVYYNDFPRVDFTLTVDWREQGSPEAGVPQLKVSFAACMTGVRIRSEGPFTVTERPADGQEQPTQKWVDASGTPFGYALYNDGRYGYDALGGRLRITLLRNGYLPDPETDNGVHLVRFAFAPHGPEIPAGDLVRKGMAFNRPLIAALSSAPAARTAPFLRVSGSDSVICTSLRLAEHSDRLLVRFFECSGRKAGIRFSLGKGIRSAEEVNFLENPVGSRVRLAGSAVNASFRPYEIKTFAVQVKP